MIAAVAPVADRGLGAGAFLGEALLLALTVGAIAFGATRVRRLVMPGWSGAPARLAEIVLGAAGLLWTSELVGTFGGFHRGIVLGAALLAGIGAGLLAGGIEADRAIEPAPGPPGPAASTVAKLLALAVVAAITAAWMVPTLGSVAAGMDRADTLWYHLPLAARFAQTGHLGSVFFFDPVFFASFYPANSEVFHALGIVFFGRDIVSPFINDGWLAVSLLACYCIGRPYGAGPQALIGGSVALGAQMLVEFQAGEGLNDITGIAFLLAAAAILVNAQAARRREGSDPERRSGSAAGGPAGEHGGTAGTGAQYGSSETVGPSAAEPLDVDPSPGAYRAFSSPALPAVAVAGLAAGLAAGVKLSFLAPLAALTVGVVWIAGAGSRRRTAVAWLAPMLAGGGYWYGRNLLAIGNPIPYIHHIGPISLPAPIRDFSLRPGFSVFHYWNDTSVWTHWFVPGLHDSLGLLWPVTVLGIAAISVTAMARAGEPILRVLGAVAGFAAIAYVFTPLTASGIAGQPIGFIWNIRYLAPSIALGFAILPCLPFLRSSPRRRALTLTGLFVLAAFTIGSLVQWHQGHVKGAVAAAAAVVGSAAVLAWARGRGIRWGSLATQRRLAIVAVLGVAILGGGYEVQRRYLDHRYEDAGAVPDLDRAFAWARDVHGARIALSGVRGIFTQYAFYGTDLSNRVQWLGHRTPHDGYARIATCAAFKQALNAGGYEYLVATFDPFDPGTLTNTPEGRWMEADPNAGLVLSQGPLNVFRIEGPLDPSSCAGQHRLTQHQLHGVPDPTNPQ